MRMKNDFHIKGWARFEAEARGNSEIAYLIFAHLTVMIDIKKDYHSFIRNFRKLLKVTGEGNALTESKLTTPRGHVIDIHHG